MGGRFEYDLRSTCARSWTRHTGSILHCQGLELDRACVTWDADFRFNGRGWDQYSFKANRWERIKKADRQSCQKNAYRVLLTRARQGMVIVA